MHFKSHPTLTRKGDQRRGPGPSLYRKGTDDDSHPLYAHIVSERDAPSKGQRVAAFYVHSGDTPTRANLKKAVVLLSRARRSDQSEQVTTRPAPLSCPPSRFIFMVFVPE